jgi:hypothetical protein
VRKDKFRVRVYARPQPEIAFALMWLNHSASVTADELLLLIKFDSAAWQVAEIPVHVIRKRLARVFDNPRNCFVIDVEHSDNRSDWCSFTERRED